MRSRRSLFGILLLLVVLSVAYKDSDRPEGKNNPCPDPVNPNMVQRPITTIKGKVGDTVILPCSREDKTDISHDRVEWFKGPTTENKPIHKYVWHGRAIQTQRDDFKDRTSLFEEELSSGDCSLRLQVNTSHSGSYYCCVPGLLYCPVNLEVLPAEDNDTSQKHQDDPVSPVNPLIHPEENTHLYDPLNPNMLQCTNTTIEGKDGDTVILPCSKKNKMDISLEEVKWTFEDPTTGKKTVHLYFQGEDYLHEQSDDFKDRTSLFKEELSSGNCSLSLLVTTSHSGRYHSCVGGRLCCTVTLKVLPKGTNDSSQKHQNVTVSPVKPNNGTDGQKNIIGGVVGGVLVLVALIIIITLAYRYREQLMNFCRRRSSNHPQTQSVSYQAQHPPQNQENEPADQNPNEERSQMLEDEDQDDPADGNESKKLE